MIQITDFISDKFSYRYTAVARPTSTADAEVEKTPEVCSFKKKEDFDACCIMLILDNDSTVALCGYYSVVLVLQDLQPGVTRRIAPHMANAGIGLLGR